MTPMQLAILRRALLPVLADDECYPPGELPRRMTDNEVRAQDGSVHRLTMRGDMGPAYVCIGDERWAWRSGVTSLVPDHPARDPGQLARLQAFWDRGPPKEAELNLSWSTGRRWVRVAWGDSFCFYAGDGWSIDNTFSPSQRATVEAFFAKGPVELAEDEFVLNDGIVATRRMYIDGDRLAVVYREGSAQNYHMTRQELFLAARAYPDPLGWPRALAYFDRHVAKPEPARVTDVRCCSPHPPRRNHDRI